MKVNTTTQYAELIGAIGSPTRLEILLLLVAAHPHGLVASALQAKLKLPASTLSHHLDRLCQRNWIAASPDEQLEPTYTVQVETIEHLLTFLYVECCDRQSLLSWETIPTRKNRYASAPLLPRQPERVSLESLIDQAVYERLSGKAMQALLIARSEALRQGGTFIGAEELLLGLMAEGSGLAAAALSAWGLELEQARAAVQRHLTPNRQGRNTLQFDTRARLVLSLSLDEATAAGHPLINTEHLLLGLIREWQLSQHHNRRLSTAAALLASLGPSPDAMTRQLLEADV